MQMKIAICDDEIAVCTRLEEIITDILTDGQLEYSIDVFYTGEGLISGMERESYNLIFLDIELTGINGIETGTYIREVLGNEQVQISYVSGKEFYAMKLFEIRPINFLIKPLTYEKVEQVIEKYIKIEGLDPIYFKYKKGVELGSIPVADILYFTSEGRKIQIVTLRGEEFFYGKMEDVYTSIKNQKFLFIHRSIIVNYRYVQNLKYESVQMIDGTEFTISQKRRRAIREIAVGIRRSEML